MVGSSLFVLWGGANDVLNHVNPQSYNGDWFSWSPTKPPPYDFALLVRNAMLDTRAIITGASGGDYGAMLFIDLPDISTVPVARYDSWQTDKTGWVSQTTGYYNQLLRDAVSSWPRTRVLRVNDFIQNWNPQRYSSQFMSGDRGARINACAQRRQSPVRAFWRDAAVAPLSSQSHAQAVCPGACTQQGSSLNESMGWNGNWTNTSTGNAVCGCNSQPGQPAALLQDAAVGSLSGQSHVASGPGRHGPRRLLLEAHTLPSPSRSAQPTGRRPLPRT